MTVRRTTEWWLVAMAVGLTSCSSTSHMRNETDADASAALDAAEDSALLDAAEAADDTDCHPEVCNGVDDDCDGNVDGEPAAEASCVTVTNGAPTCVSGACGFVCNVGYHACGDTCASDSSPLTCGTRCEPCDAPPAHASASCNAATCDFTCDPGFAVSGVGCDVAPPRPLAPLSTATVTSRRPTLRWELAPATDGAVVELCLDRACTIVLETIEVSGSSITPTTDLPTGVVFWRLRSRIGASVATLMGPTWQLVVGARTAPIDTSWGSTLDANGDGHADVLVGALVSDRAFLYLGSMGGLAASPSATLHEVDGDQLGSSVASAGDVDGDGYSDVIIGAPRGERAYVYRGGEAGLDPVAATTLTGPSIPFAFFGGSVAGVGDVNGDGYGDVLVGGIGTSAEYGRAYLFLGGPSGLSSTPSTTLDAPAGHGFGESVASAGDVDGDGYADVVIGGCTSSGGAIRAFVYRGSATGLVMPPSTLIGSSAGSGDLGAVLTNAGDLDGDGYADVVVGANEVGVFVGRVSIFYGGPIGVSIRLGTVLDGFDGTFANFGGALASTGDMNGDGYADLAIATDMLGSGEPRVYVYWGDSGGVGTVPGTTLLGPEFTSFGHSLAATNLDGDDYWDLVIGVPSGAGRIDVFPGAASGLAPAPTTTTASPESVDSFGYAVAGS